MASLFPCPEVLRDCDCSEYPVRNFSQETADVPIFIANVNVPPDGPMGFFSPGCLDICTSEISQADADECALRQAFECSIDRGEATLIFRSDNRKFGNTQQSCDAECAGGAGTVTSIVIPGTVVSAWQSDANARAHALACKKALELRVCFVTASPLASVNASELMSVLFDAEGGTEPYVFTLTGGSLPAGTELNAEGNLFGTPTVAGAYSFSITATDAVGTSVVKVFALEVAAACDASTDWCTNPGTCRLRIKNFNAADWVAGPAPCDVSFLNGWDGTFEFTAQNGLNPCLTYKAVSEFSVNPSCDVNFNGPNWIINFSIPIGTMAFYDGPVASPIGIYTRNPSFSCTGPATLEIEAYTPP